MKLLFYGWPLAVLLMFFVWDDPFSVIYRDDGIAEKSDDIQRFKVFSKTCESAGYNAFVFGNSKANNLGKDYLMQRLGKDYRVFHFNAPGDCILNIYKKLLSAEKCGCDIKFAIILIDNGILLNSENKSETFSGPVYQHSVHTSEIGYFDFYSRYINYYFTDFFFGKYLCYRFTGNYEPWMKESFPAPGQKNGIGHVNPKRDSLLENNFAEYKKRFKPNYSRSFDTARIVTKINASDILYLEKIKDLLKVHKTEYVILVPPGFNQLKFTTTIQKQLNSIFADHIVDFSGVNRITSDSTLNYERTHFSQKAGRMILDSIFELYKPHENH